jgi:hypothetical protein
MIKAKVTLDLIALDLNKATAEKINRTIGDACAAYLKQEYPKTVMVRSCAIETAESSVSDIIELLSELKDILKEEGEC